MSVGVSKEEFKGKFDSAILYIRIKREDMTGITLNSWAIDEGGWRKQSGKSL